MAAREILYKSLYWKGLQFLSSFIVNIILARSFQSTISAEFYALVYLLSLGISFFSLGLDISLNYYLSRNKISPGRAGLIIVMAVLLALAVCLPLLYLFYNPSRYPDLGLSRGQLLLFAAFNITGGLLTTLSGTLFTAYGRSHLPAIMAFFTNLLMALLSLMISSSGAGDAVAGELLKINFLFSFVQGLFLFLLSMKMYTGKRTEPYIPVRATALLHFSFTAWVINFIFFAGARLIVYLLPYRTSLADQGNYIQAYKIVEYMSLLTSVIYYPFIALAAGEDRGKIKKKVLFLVRLSNTLVLLAAVMILACGWWLFPLLFGRSFDRMYEIFIGFLPGLFAVCSSTFFTAWYFGSGRLKYNLISACIQFVCTPVFFFVFVRDGNPVGAAFAFSLAALASLLYDMFVFRKTCFYKIPEILFAGKEDLNAVRLFIRQILK